MSQDQKSKEIPKNHSIRKGCFFCYKPLLTFKEKVLRSCTECAKNTLNGFDKMSQGKVKEGFKDVKNVVFGHNKESKQIAEAQMKKALKTKRKKIIKDLKKKGLEENQIEKELKKFDEALQ